MGKQQSAKVFGRQVVLLVGGLALLLLGLCIRGQASTRMPLLIAHRGSHQQLPEHTLLAYEQAIQEGCDYIELDLRLTTDGQLIVLHDETVDRTTDGSGVATSFSLAAIKELSISTASMEKVTIPTVAEVFQTFGHRTRYYIELRSEQEVLPLKKLLVQYQLVKSSEVTLQSFSVAALQVASKALPTLPQTLLFRTGKFDLQQALQSHAEQIGLSASDVSWSRVKQLQKNGKKVHVFFTDQTLEREQQVQWRQYGIDGYFTDDVPFTQQVYQRQ